jgi:hypothetical protein
MNELIACCGLNCEWCDARIATVKDDDTLRQSTLDKWRAMYNAENLNISMINCTGCRVEGVKYYHCLDCEIRKCVNVKGFKTCGECTELDTCAMITKIHKYVPEAHSNLINLK